MSAFRAFSTMNFVTFLAKSNLTYTSLAMVRSSAFITRPNVTVSISPHVHPQSGPAVGISFCLIIVRLGRILPEARDNTLEVSIRTPASRSRPPDHLAVSFPQVEAQRNVWVRGSNDLPMGSLESQKREYVDSSSDLPKPLRPSLSLSTPG